MRHRTPRLAIAALIIGTVLSTAACAAAEESEAIMDVPAARPAGDEVMGQGTVIQKPGSSVQLCLGAITMIYPPDCGGVEIAGWDWDSVDGAETVDGTTWGTYAVQGVWDGTRLTVTEAPIMLALFDPPATDESLRDPANAGASSDSDLTALQAELSGDERILGSYPENGYLFVEVLHDDGSLQSEYDAAYGPGVVVVRSQLTSVD